jgi:uncharacterized protein (TIGR04255 family)
MQNSMTRTNPKRLRQEPLIEAIWHLTYRPSKPIQAVADVLVGVLYTALKKRNGDYQVHRLLPVDIPTEVAEQDPDLRYTVKYRLENPDSPVLYLIGDRIVSLNCRRPYIGWQRLREEIAFLKGVLEESELIIPERHGLRYIDLIRREYMSDLSGLQLQVRLGEQEVRTQPIHLRVELDYLDRKHTVRISSPAQAEIAGETWNGTLIDLEVGVQIENSWHAISDNAIDELHHALNSLFFTQILTQDLIDKLEPEYKED